MEIIWNKFQKHLNFFTRFLRKKWRKKENVSEYPRERLDGFPWLCFSLFSTVVSFVVSSQGFCALVLAFAVSSEGSSVFLCGLEAKKLNRKGSMFPSECLQNYTTCSLLIAATHSVLLALAAFYKTQS